MFNDYRSSNERGHTSQIIRDVAIQIRYLPCASWLQGLLQIDTLWESSYDTWIYVMLKMEHMRTSLGLAPVLFLKAFGRQSTQINILSLAFKNEMTDYQLQLWCVANTTLRRTSLCLANKSILILIWYDMVIQWYDYYLADMVIRE